MKSNQNKDIDNDKLALTSVGTINTIMASTLANLESAKNIAESIKNSNLGKNFETIDKDNNPVINTDDIVAAILLGAELGLTPMKTLMLGRELNDKTYISIVRGRSLGLDEVTSMKNIHVFKTSGGSCIYVGVHIVSKILTDCKVDIQWIDDYKTVYTYIDSALNMELDSEKVESNLDRYYIITDKTDVDKLQEAIKAGKKVLRRKSDKLTSAKFIRGDRQPVHIKFYLSEAVEAGLYKGVKSDGTAVDGKSNWNNYPSRQMRNRVIIYGGREVAADKLHGIYLPDEVSSISSKFNDNDVEDVEVIE